MSVTVRQRCAREAAGFEGPAASGDAFLPTRPLAAHTTDGRTAREVVFYRLGEKFVDHERSIPEDVRSVLYYTLAIGHHTGVIDCLAPRLTTSREVFADVLALLGPGEAHDKLAGIEKFGEIEVKKEHVPGLKPAVLVALDRGGAALEVDDEPPLRAMSEAVVAIDALAWLEECEPCVYAMGRRVTC